MVEAVIFNELGGSDVLHVIPDYELPPKQDGKVHAKPACPCVTVLWSRLKSSPVKSSRVNDDSQSPRYDL